VEQRATGLFLSVLGPIGVVVSIAAWMLDSAICAGMTMGSPRVDLATLVELKRLLIDTATVADSRATLESFGRITMTCLKLPARFSGRRMNLLFDTKRSEGLGALERERVIATLAQILMQAAGLGVEELEDDKL